MTAVQLINITQSFAGKPVLNELSLVTESGQYVVLLGASGCGKTTLLRVIAGLQIPDSGDVRCNGRSLSGVPPRRRDVSLVPQHDGLYPHRTIAQSIRLPLRALYDSSEIESRVEFAVDLTGIRPILDRYPDGLSGGELRRSAIAKAIARGASVRLLDEPLSALDAPVRQSLQDDLLSWHQQIPGTTIHVTHDGQEAMRIADVIAVIDQGRVVQFGDPMEIYQFPASVRVAQSVGAPTINLFECRLESGVARACEHQMDLANADIPEPRSNRILLGIRPGDLKLNPGKRPLSVSGNVRRVQPINGRYQLTISSGPSIVHAVVDHVPVTIGETVCLYADAEQTLVFDLATENRIGQAH